MKNKKLLGAILLAGTCLVVFNYFYQKSLTKSAQLFENSVLVSTTNTYIPLSDIVTVTPPVEHNFGNFKIHFPSTLPTNKEVIDCYSGDVLQQGSKVLLSGGDGFSGYGWGYAIGVSQTQINPEVDTNFRQDQYGACPNDYSAHLLTLKIVKDYDYAEMQKIGFEDDNTKFIDEEKISIGNIETQAKVYEYTVTPPKPLYGKAGAPYKLMIYHFNVNDDYFIIQKRTYDGTTTTAFDDTVLNEAIDYIWNHLEFEQK